MINLIPPKEKRDQALEVIYQRLFSLLLFAFFAFCIFLFIISGLRLFISEKAQEVEGLVSLKQIELDNSNFQAFQTTVKETNQYIAQVRSFWQGQIFISHVLEKIALLKPNSIYFNTLSLNAIHPSSQVAISGFSQTRGALFYFKQNLESELSFDGVYFAPTSWVKPTDIDFSLNFVVPQPK